MSCDGWRGGSASISSRNGRTAWATEMEEVHPAMTRVWGVRKDTGGSAADFNDPGGTAAPHGDEDDGRISSAVERSLKFDASFNGIREGPRIQKDGEGEGLGTGDGLSDSVPFVGGAREGLPPLIAV